MSEIHPAIAGLVILSKYYPNDDLSIKPLSMIQYAPYEPDKISPKDFAKLQALGWREEEGYFRKYNCWSYDT